MNIKYSVYTLHGSLPKLDDIIELVNLNGGKHKMSKVVAHMGKLKAENLGGIQRHNERLNNSYSNDMIDVSRSYLNYDLVKKSELSYKETVDKHIAENIVLKRALRKDAVLVNEWIISSDREFFDKLNDRQIREYFQTVVDYFNEKCGNHVVYGNVHLDESTPHMHLGVVPIIDGKLSSKKLFDRKMLRDIQEELPKRLKEKGFDIERGILGSEQKHLTVKEYKANQQAVAEMKEQLEKLKEQANQLELNVSLLQDIRNMDSDLREVNENHLLSHALMEIAKTPKYSTSGKLDKRALENLYMSEVSPFDDGRLNADKFYAVHRNAIEREIDKFEKTLGVDIRKDVPREEYKSYVSSVAVNSYANELLKGIEMLPKRLKRDEDMERAKIDYERLEREIERSNRQRQFEFDFNW